MSKPKEYSSMTKDKLMTYTFIALLVLAIVSAVMWSSVTEPSGWNLGLSVAIISVIAVGISVGVDALLYKLTADSPLNTMSAAVFGLIVALSYSLGSPLMGQTEGSAVASSMLEPPSAFIYVALISLIGLVLFKKLLGKKVNPAAAAKFIVLLPFVSTVLLAKEHFADYMSGGLGVPKLAGPIGGGMEAINNNGLASFGTYLQQCYSFPDPTAMTYPDVNNIMMLEKYHGWVGGASSLAVIIVGVALFIVARRYIKWRITLTYFVSIAIMSVIMSTVYADADLITRLVFEVFIGSSIFLGFFMATDPATTPITYTGQIIFGVGLGVLTVLIQTYMNFFGGSILALIIMNLAVAKLDQVGKLKPTTDTKEPKLPKAKAFPAEKVKEYGCMKCGACMRVCCHNLSPILIKQAFDKQDFDALVKLHADYCTGCGHCTFICPSRIDLRKSVLQAKGALRGQ
ncbi:MAG: RnfABCDGE type electron transport complex subunit D [Candidatus Bathyarchaeota archaeon]|nr:RnfABCDGE type electron transport complex subunit D [Candidatus Bathyarchaeota archaeon]